MAIKPIPFIFFLLLLLLPTSLSLPFPITEYPNKTQVYIVHVEHPSADVELLSARDRDDWYRSFLPNSTLDSGDPRLVFTYSAAISGFAARLTAGEVKAMETIPGFLHAYLNQELLLRTTHTPALLGLDEYSSLWQHTNQGEGIIIGVIDSGITPDHASFSGGDRLPEPPLKWRGRCDFPSGNCSNKLIGARAFLEGGSTSPVDESGHGTHVSAIAAGSPVPDASIFGHAQGTASGMAPKAHISLYKACSPSSCSDANMIKSFDQAIIDGVDLVQISLGGPNKPYDENGIVSGSFAALRKGILTVNSAGNDGPAKSVLDNDVPWILTVGAATIDRRVTGVLKLGNGMEFTGQSVYMSNSSATVNLPLVYPGAKGNLQTQRCTNGSLARFNVTGKLVLCRAGQTHSTDKAEVVRAAGGAAVAILNTPLEGDTLSGDPFFMPGIQVSFNDAEKILNYYETASNAAGSITLRGTEYGIRPSPTVASLSSRGPSRLNGGILKPDVIAPGVGILSAWHREIKIVAEPRRSNELKKSFVTTTGTSMAAPHVSGVAALLKKSHPDWSPSAIKSAIMTTARMLDRDGNPITDDASNSRARASIFAAGAGHINPSAANDPGLVYETNTDDYIPYLCGLKYYTAWEVKAIVNERVSCSKKMAAEEVNYPAIQVSMGSAGAKNKTIKRTVKNVGEASSTYTAKVVEPSGVTVEVKPKTLQFSNIGEEKSFTVELSLSGKNGPTKDEVWEGRLKWISGKREVSSPIAITA
ncbi:Subtilisin-like protease [Apostasia shenzhenica]|uniref:Subtilisin-like protease n=1 Tax=Apostasia shenzhenica TaxID=1088818 RepID=A0A2I0AXH6_9ASPA|nr:Subtilisin-like protease [Apostasia shenzhenica]